jgi:hypothetical protein
MISVAERKRNAEKRIQRKKKRGEIEINWEDLAETWSDLQIKIRSIVEGRGVTISQ